MTELEVSGLRMDSCGHLVTITLPLKGLTNEAITLAIAKEMRKSCSECE